MDGSWQLSLLQRWLHKLSQKRFCIAWGRVNSAVDLILQGFRLGLRNFIVSAQIGSGRLQDIFVDGIKMTNRSEFRESAGMEDSSNFRPTAHPQLLKGRHVYRQIGESVPQRKRHIYLAAEFLRDLLGLD